MEEELKAYNLIWSISGLTMAAVTLPVLVALILLKTYTTPLKRMLLALTVFTLLDLINNSLNIILQPKFFKHTVCKAIGYADVCIFITSLLLWSGIGLYLLGIIYYYIQGKPLPKVSKAKAGVVEAIFLLGVIAIPPVVMQKNVHKFGVAGPLCWIQVYEEEEDNSVSCRRINADFERVILSTYTAIMSINVAIFILLKAISCLLAYRQEHVRSHHMHMVKRASLLLTFLLLSFVINIVSLWSHHKTVDSRIPFAVLVIVAILVPASPIIIPLGFIIYLTSAKTLRIKQFKTAASKWMRRLSHRVRRSVELKDDATSLPSPGSQEASSSNTVSREVGYTGAFTDVSTTYGSIDQTRYSE